MMDVSIVKKSSNSQQFDPLKLHQSVAAACLAVRSLEGEADSTAQQVCKRVLAWLVRKEEVTSSDIRRIASQALTVYHPEAAYMYEQHDLIA